MTMKKALAALLSLLLVCACACASALTLSVTIPTEIEVFVTCGEGGSVLLDEEEITDSFTMVRKDDEKVLTIAPNEGSMLSSVTVSPEKGAVVDLENQTITLTNLSANAQVTVSFIGDHEHTYAVKEQTACTGVGYRIWGCTYEGCNATWTEYGTEENPLDHPWDAGIKQPATRKNEGFIDYHCTMCSEAKHITLPVRTDLAVLSLPDALLVIEDEAFMNSGAQCVAIPDGCTQIGSLAFADCVNLELVEIPASVEDIAEDILEGSPNAAIVTSQGSPAAQFAEENSILYVIE